MKAVQIVEIGGPLEQREIPVPEVGDRDVLVRVKAAGICHSDAHYRAGNSPVGPLPITPGHEVAGVVEETGDQVGNLEVGDRVCLHYLITCGDCPYCAQGSEQFCIEGSMIGKYRDGGYAEYIAVPARSAVLLPDEIPFEEGAIMMCSSATSFHALRKSRLTPGETVIIFGVGGLGMSAVQLAHAMGALDVYAVDINAERLAMAGRFGAVPINASEIDPVERVRSLTDGRGVDVALELIGLPLTMHQAVQSLAVFGRAVMVGIASQPLEIDTYRELLGREGEVIGASDHLLQELPLLVEYARRGILDLSSVVTGTAPLDADAINAALDQLEEFGGGVRTVITP
ncbi:MAG: zinc-binding dehydrogenase [Chloroflexota bacterium]|nr:zinc-binding dehydrogenase [Chloroflexota bacterium]